jgi:hypothetical protein
MYGTLFAEKSRMFDIYRKEHRHFIDSIGKGAVTPVPREMDTDLLRMLSEDTDLENDITIKTLQK